MLDYLLYFLAPGEKIPPGASQFSIGNEGLSWGWAFFAFVALLAGLVWSYIYYAPNLGRITRIGIIILRTILFAILLIVLVRPFLLITLEEKVRRPLLVLLDNTQSMSLLKDRRVTPDDLARAAIAKGLISPSGGLQQTLPGDAESLRETTRQQILEAEAANTQLNLWPRIFDHASLHFFGFGLKTRDLGELTPAIEGAKLTTDDATDFFHHITYEENRTAIGDSLRDLLDDQRGQPISGIFLITDGGNNAGISPVDAAAIAKQDGVPLFIYGVGVTSPQDIMVSEVDGPQVSNVKEKVNMTVHVRAQSMIGKTATLQLKADGKIVATQDITFHADGEQEITIGYVPDVVGTPEIEAYIPPLPEEAVKDNNSAKTRVRITDDKIKILLVEEEPRWDFQYLLAMLQRDRRMKVKAVLLKGDPGLSAEPNSPFLDHLPEDKEGLYANDLIILGDVDPTELGDTRMKLISDWVDKMGGGLVFLAGPKFDPNAYQGTPLEPLLPVETAGKPSEEYGELVQLKLTPAGEASPFLMISPNPEENLAAWNAFPGVRWTAWVDKARPGAEVLLTDPTPSRANRVGQMPVIAQESYGLGQTLYIGTDETYRWRSRTGEKFYTQIWDQMIQGVTSQHNQGATALTQLKTDRPSYLTGDRIKITGRIFKSGFEPVTDAEIPGILTLTPEPKKGQPIPAPIKSDLRLEAIPDQPGSYHAEMIAQTAGSYTYSTVRDPSVVVKFDVAEPNVELSDIAMNESLLIAMANASGGHYFREENLDKLPDMVASQSSGNVSFKKIILSNAPILLVLMILVACAEWLWRRRSELK